MEHDNRITDPETARLVKRSMEQQKRAAFWNRIAAVGFWMWVSSLPVILIGGLFVPVGAFMLAGLLAVLGMASSLFATAMAGGDGGSSLGDVDRYYDSVNDG